jgi:hypothetical protein
MEIIYCSKCGQMIPPGGIDEGKYRLVDDEPVCIKCYEKIPPEKHTGDTLLGEQKVERPKAGDELAPRPGRRPRTPPSTRSTPAARRKPSTRGLPAARRTRTASDIAAGKRGGGSSGLVVTAVVMVLLFGGALALVGLRSGGNGSGRVSGGKQRFRLTVKIEGDGTGAVVVDPPRGPYDSGTVLTLTPKPAKGSRFVAWRDGGRGNPRRVVMHGPVNAIACFAKGSSAGTGQIPAVPPSVEPIAHWKLDAVVGGQVGDVSGKGHHGKVSGGPKPMKEGARGGALTFDGVDDQVRCPRLAGLAKGNAPHTIAAWLRVEALPEKRSWILVLGQDGKGAHHWLLHANGELQLGAWGGKNSPAQVRTGLRLGRWTHLAVTTDGKTLLAYVDGVRIGRAESGFDLRDVGLVLARAASSLDEEELSYAGGLDDVRVYNRALKPEEVAALAEVKAPAATPRPADGPVAHWRFGAVSGGVIKDCSGIRLHGKAAGGPKLVTGKFGKALEFDGEDDYVEVTSSPRFDSAGTWALWVRTDGKWGSDNKSGESKMGCAVLMSRCDLEGSLRGATLGLRPDGRPFLQLKAAKDSGSLRKVCDIWSSTGVTDGRWHHVSAVFSRQAGGSSIIYVDGKRVAGSRNTAGWAFAGQPLVIGGSKDPFWEEFKGAIDDVRVYSRALSAKEIARLAAGQASPVGPDPKAAEYWVKLKRFNGKSGKAEYRPRVEEAGSGQCFRKGALGVTDAKWTWARVPAELEGRARIFGPRQRIKLANLDKTYEVSVARPCTVYVVFSGREGDKKLSWMDPKWSSTGWKCKPLTDKVDYQWLVWKREVPEPGRITLGSDTRGGESVNYVFVPKKAAAVKPPAALPAGQVYLTDLKPLNTNVPDWVHLGETVKLAEKTHEKCIVMKSKGGSTPKLTFSLGGAYGMLRFETAKMAAEMPSLQFYVYGDGKQLLVASPSAPCSVDVSGVKVLGIRIWSVLSKSVGRAVWISPRLTKKAVDLPAAAAKDELRLAPSADATLNKHAMDRNCGKEEVLLVGRPTGGNAFCFYLEFDVSGIEGEVESAGLQLHLVKSVGVTARSKFTVFNCLPGHGQTETAMTYRNQPRGSGAVRSFDASKAVPLVHVTKAVNRARAHEKKRLCLKVVPHNTNEEKGFCAYGSREGPADKRPQLIITLKKK